jgi:predicted peptidase
VISRYKPGVTLEFEVDGRRRRAAIWLPDDYDPARRWPLLVFLHAYEERGDDFEHLEVGLGPALRARPDLFPCVAVLPQCPADAVWSWIDRPWAQGQIGAEAHIDAAIEGAVRRFSVDPRRIALTGASMGGYGTFLYGSRHAGRFSALVPICGGGQPEGAAELAGARVWVIHGAADELVPPEESRSMVAAIRSCGGTGELRYSEYDNVGHAAWERAYVDPEVAAFLFAERAP